MNRLIFLAAALLVIFAAADSSAQGFLNPFIATTLSSPTDAGSSTKPGFGISFGSLGNAVGGETEISYFPELIDNSANAIAKNKVVTFSGDALIGPTIGRRVKPYFAIGAGDLHLNVTKGSVALPSTETISNNYFTFNAGGGVIGFFTGHLGARVDLRYTRAFGIKITDLEAANLALDKFNFWRATFGLAVKF